MTSIEWLIEEMLSKGFFKESVTLTNIDHLQYKAEEMHKQEILLSYHEGSEDLKYNPQEYYNETFVSKGSDETPMERKLLKSGFVDVVPKQETLYTEEQVREAIEDARDILSYVNTDEVIQSLKQPKKN
jgi:hypothetical protein